MANTQVRIDVKNFNGTVPQSASCQVEDVARGKIYYLWAGRGSGADNVFHNREILFCAVDRATRTPSAPVVVEADGANDLDALSMLLMADGTIVVAYGQNGVRVRESTDGGANWSAGITVDGTYGAASRIFCCLIGSLDGTLAAVVTQEQSGGNTNDLYLSKRTGAAAWDAVRKIHDAAGAATSPFFDFTVARSKGTRCGWIVDANTAFLVADYSNASSAIDQVRALYTTNGWTSSATSLVYDYTGTGTSRNPVATLGADGKARAMWVASGGGDPVLVVSANNGATWSTIGTPAPLAAEAWGTRDRFLAVDASSIMYAGTFKAAAEHKVFRGAGGDSVLGWVDISATGLSNIADSAGVGDGLIDSVGDLWRLYTRNNAATYELWALVVGDVVPAPPVPPEPGDPDLEPTILAKITLTDTCGNGARTLYFGMPAFEDPTGQPWEDVIEKPSQTAAGGAPLSSRWNPADGDLRLRNVRVTGQAPGEKLVDLFNQYEWVGAAIVIQYAFSGIAFVDGAFPILDGRITDIRELDELGVTLYCEQDDAWAAVLTPPRVLTLDDYPLMPKDTVGQRAQIVYGDWSADREFDSIFGSPMALWGSCRGGLPLQPIEMPSHGALQTPKYLVSDRQDKAVAGAAYVYESSLNTYSFTNDAPTEANPDGGPATLQLASRTFILAVPPIDPTADDTTDGYGTLFATDKPRDLSGYAVLDYDAGHILLALKLPDLSTLGEFVSAGAQIAYAKNAWSAPLGRWGLATGIFSGGIFGTEVANSFPAGGVALPVTTPTGADSISASTSVITSWADLAASKLFVQLKAAGQKIQIHRIVVTVHYKPNAEMVKPSTLTYTRQFGRGTPGLPGSTPSGIVGTGGLPAEFSFVPNLAAFPQGVPDENHRDLGAGAAADGTYTGTPGALIENPVDLAHWLLAEIGAVPAAEFVTGAADFGSFARARTALAGYKMFGALNGPNDGTDLQAILADLSRECACWFVRRTAATGSPFVAIPWDPGTAANYRSSGDPYIFEVGPSVALNSLRMGRTSRAEVANVVRVNFDFDPRAGTYAEQVYISDTASRGWTGSAFARDQNAAAPYNREALAAASVASFRRREYVHNAPHVKDPFTATDLLQRLFDWKVQPRVLIELGTFLNAADLERGHVIQLGSTWDALRPYPKPCSDGSWVGKNLMVYEVRRLAELPNQYAIKAVET